jgi:hypothetical protein
MREVFSKQVLQHGEVLQEGYPVRRELANRAESGDVETCAILLRRWCSSFAHQY